MQWWKMQDIGDMENARNAEYVKPKVQERSKVGIPCGVFKSCMHMAVHKSVENCANIQSGSK